MDYDMVPFQAVKRKQIADEVAEQLQRKITAGEWSAGTKIPTEPELMKLFGVGRSTVREAVSELVHVGLLEKKQGHGTFVCQPTTSQKPLDYRLSRAEIIKVYEVRSVLELEIARLAALRRNDEDLRLMREALDRSAATLAAGDLVGYLDASRGCGRSYSQQGAYRRISQLCRGDSKGAEQSRYRSGNAKSFYITA